MSLKTHHSCLPDLDLVSSGPNLLPPLRMSPSALSEIIETFQRMPKKDDFFLFGTLMGSVNAQGEYLVSSVVCLYYEYFEMEDQSKLHFQLPNNWKNIIESHQNLYNSKCLGAFLVNPKQNDILDGVIVQTISEYMRSKMESHLRNLLLKIHINPDSPQYNLNAFVILPNKYFLNSFANMSEIPVLVDYIPETARKVHQNFLFYQMQKGDLANLEAQSLEKLIKILDGSIQQEEDDVGMSEEMSPVKLGDELLQMLNSVLTCRRQVDRGDLEAVRVGFEEDKGVIEEVLHVLEEQIEVSKKLAFDVGSGKK